MSVPSIFVILLLLGSSLSMSSPGAPINPNDIIRESINNAAGKELIPKDAKFKLTEFRGEPMSDTQPFLGDGYGSLSDSVFTEKFSDGANSNSNKSQMLNPIIFLTWTLLALKRYC